MQAQKAQEPPKRSRSTMATLWPPSRASSSAASPAGPAPMMTKSKVSWGSVTWSPWAWRMGSGAEPTRLPLERSAERGHDVGAPRSTKMMSAMPLCGCVLSHCPDRGERPVGRLVERIAVDAAADGRRRRRCRPPASAARSSDAE